MKFDQINEDIPPMADIAAMATVAGLAAPVMMAMLKAAYKTGKGINAIRKIAKRAGVKLADRVMGVNELKIVKPNPKDTKGIKRSDMPQVSNKDYPEFFEYLKSNGATFEMQRDIPANTFKSTQGEFSDAGIERSMTKLLKGAKKKPIIVSQDNYIIDGHHRWLVAMNLGNSTVDTIKISMDADELLALVKAFNKTSYKDIYSEKIDKFNKDEPNKSTVAVPGYGTMNIDSLMKNVIDQTTQMLTQMKQGTQGFRNADYELNNNRVLTTKIAALVQALDDLQAIRSKGGANSRNIQQESTLAEAKYTVTKAQIKKMIIAAAKKYGIDPKVALMVWKSEGYGSYQSQVKVGKDSNVKSVNGMEASWGPFQLYTGGGLGNDYETKYGVKLADDNTEEGIARQIDFALNNAASSGKGWAPWYGPSKRYDDWDNFKGLPGGTDYTPPPSDAVPADAPATGNLTYQRLAKINDISNPDLITPGTVLTLPNGSTHTVQPGDTLSGIATTYNTTAPPETYVPPATDKVDKKSPPKRDDQGRLIVTKPAATRWKVDKKAIDKAVKQAIDYEPESDPSTLTKDQRDAISGTGKYKPKARPVTKPKARPVTTANTNDTYLKQRLAKRNANSGTLMASEQQELPIDVKKIIDNIQEFESKQYIQPEDADLMRRGVQSLTSGRQTVNSEAILQLLTMVTR